MKDWVSEYKSKLKTADEAVKIVKSGDLIMPTHGAGECRLLMEALMRRADRDEIEDVQLWLGLNWSEESYCLPQYEDKIIANVNFAAPATREAIWDGRALFNPGHFHTFPKMFRTGQVKMNGYFGHVSPPDENGYVSFGISVDLARACLDTCDYAIAQVNKNMPRTCGETLAHISEFDFIVESDEPIFERAKGNDADPVTAKIGKIIADMIDDGACLQMGQGKIPDAILSQLFDKRDLGIHTEVFSDNLIPLIEAGVITGAKKTLNNRKIVATFIQGTRELYDFIDNNGLLHMMPVDYVNSPHIISQLDNMTAINSCLEIDMMGQVTAEAMGAKQFSGIGGQLDFLRGAGDAVGGKPILAMPSTAKGGEISRITAVLKPGTPVTTTRNDVHWVVTEFGAVNLFGRPIKERAKLLLSIAHPKFQEGLEREFAAYIGQFARSRTLANI